MKKWKKLSSEIKHKNPWWEYVRDEFELPDGKKGEYFFMSTPGSVVILPITSDGKVVCARQYRYLIDRFSLEFPGGGIKEGQSPEDAARDELAEEVNFTANKLEKVATFAPLAGFVRETTHVFIAVDLSHSEGELDATEEFEIEHLNPEDIEQKIINGEMFNGWALSAWVVAKPHVLKTIDRIKNSG